MECLNQDNSKYDAIPVIYCKSCLSIKIKNCLSNIDTYPLVEGKTNEYDYCDDCGSTDLDTCSIQDYQEMYKQRYGHYPLETF